MHEMPGPLRALLCNWRMKIGLSSTLAVVYWTGYYFIERHLWRTPVRLDLSPIDRWIGFSPGWVWGYQSIYLMLPLPFLATTRRDLRRYAIGFILMMAAAFACFILFPIRGPRPAIAPMSGAYGFLARYDLPFNNLPSLHLAVATYSACVAIRVTHGKLRRMLKLLLPPWVLLIGYAALAIKQHYAIDLPPGILLGWLAQRIAWRTSRDPRERRGI